MVEVTSLSLGGCTASSPGGRRLQEELSFDYVIRFPPSSPSAAGGQSVAQATAKQLAEIPVNEVTTLVRQRLAEQPIFKDVEVEVLSVEVKVIEVTSTTSGAPQQDPEGGADGEIVALVAAPIALLLFCPKWTSRAPPAATPAMATESLTRYWTYHRRCRRTREPRR